MTLEANRRLGAYQITAPLGAGGMGEVYRATDTTLGREVAIKVLPADVAHDAERLARFEREARVLASLNHPNIASIYGFEQSDGVPYLVMELVEGEDLAQRLSHGPVPVDEAIAIARQIAEALEAAHEKGIVHRDLKPANVKVTPDGSVKVLDFGLAKAYASDAASGPTSDLSHSPTLAYTGTAAGLILGTAAYMSPEQARGQPVDKRADIWAFGVVLYEMLTGRRLFEGQTVSDTLAAVLTREIDWKALPSATPAELRRLLQRCLDRDRRNRLRDIGEARVAVGSGQFASVSAEVVETRPRGFSTRVALFGVVLAIAAGALAGWMAPKSKSLEARPLARFAIDTGHSLLSPSFHQFGGLAISRDGQRVACVASDGAVVRLYQRTMDSMEVRVLPGTEGAENPFFSPDGKWIGFFSNRMLKKVSVEGGAPVALAPAHDNRGGSWTDGDEIVFAPSAGGGLLRINAGGGSLRPLTQLDRSRAELSHRWPSVITGANAVLFTTKTKGLQTFDDAPVEAVRLADGERKNVLTGGTGPSYSSTGHLVYARGGALLAAAFDASRLTVTGPSFTALEGVSRSMGTGSAHYALSQAGALLSLPGSVDLENRTLVRTDREGHVETLSPERRPFIMTRTSPDGRRLALWIGFPDDEVWTYEIDRHILTRLVPGAAKPVWSADGQWVITAKEGDLVRSRADGSGEPELLLKLKQNPSPTSVSPDGRLLAFAEDSGDTGLDVFALSLETRQAHIVLGTRSNESAAAFSPDGRWLAYVSDETGRNEVYIQAFPGPGGKRLVSGGGGTAPVWGRPQGELFYQNGAEIMAVSLRVGTSLQLSTPRKVVGGVLPNAADDVTATWDLAPGGQGFVMPQQLAQKQASTLMLMLNWAPGASSKGEGR